MLPAYPAILNFYFLHCSMTFTILGWYFPYINTNQPWVYMCPPSRTPLSPPSPSHPSGLSQCTGFECPVSCTKLGLVIYFPYATFISVYSVIWAESWEIRDIGGLCFCFFFFNSSWVNIQYYISDWCTI